MGKIARQVRDFVEDSKTLHRISKKDVAREMGISPTHFSSLLHARIDWSATLLEELAEAMIRIYTVKKIEKPTLVLALQTNKNLRGYEELCQKLQLLLSSGGDLEVAVRAHIEALHHSLTCPIAKSASDRNRKIARDAIRRSAAGI